MLAEHTKAASAVTTGIMPPLEIDQMHNLAQLHRRTVATDVTALRISDHPDTIAALTAPPISATWDGAKLTLGNEVGYQGDYVVQFQNSHRHIIPYEHFEEAYQPLEALHEVPLKPARHIIDVYADLDTIIALTQAVASPAHTGEPTIIHGVLSHQLQQHVSQMIHPSVLQHQSRYSLDADLDQIVSLISDLPTPGKRRPPEHHHHISIATRFPQRLLPNLPQPPGVAYPHPTGVIDHDLFNAALTLMAQVHSEETDRHQTPRSLLDLPIETLDALGREIAAKWLAYNQQGKRDVREPMLSYPEPGLTGSLALWGLTPEDLFIC